VRRVSRCSKRTAVFEGQYENLEPIIEFVTQAAREAGLDNSAVQAVQLAVDEACANIIEHAYANSGIGDIECTCCIEADRLTITLVDHGVPFDLDSVPRPCLAGKLEERPERGLGVYIMCQLMDEVRHEFSPQGGNILTLVKRRGTQP